MLLKLCHFKYICQQERPEPVATVCNCVSLLFTNSAYFEYMQKADDNFLERGGGGGEGGGAQLSNNRFIRV